MIAQPVGPLVTGSTAPERRRREEDMGRRQLLRLHRAAHRAGCAELADLLRRLVRRIRRGPHRTAGRLASFGLSGGSPDRTPAFDGGSGSLAAFGDRHRMAPRWRRDAP